eukprot:COSAG03_NODE_25439_length_265_cov_1.222892_1_plen_61_part_10
MRILQCTVCAKMTFCHYEEELWHSCIPRYTVSGGIQRDSKTRVHTQSYQRHTHTEREGGGG